MLKDLENVVLSAGRFAKRCSSDSLIKEFGETLPDENGPRTWEKIKWYVLSNEKKYPKMETLSVLEQILRRMKDITRMKIRRSLCGINKVSVWSRSCDYIFLLLARSAFSTFRRFEHVFPKGETMNCSRSDLHFCSKRRFSDHRARNSRWCCFSIALRSVIKLVSCPHFMIGRESRDDLYNMLPAGVRISLRARLKPFAKSLGSSVRDAALAGKWTEAISGILEWLAPLAHNMIRWQHEKSFERLDLFCRTNVFLVQTIYYARQEKTEAAIVELLVGLSYAWRFGRELDVKALEG